MEQSANASARGANGKSVSSFGTAVFTTSNELFTYQLLSGVVVYRLKIYTGEKLSLHFRAPRFITSHHHQPDIYDISDHRFQGCHQSEYK